MSEKKLRPLLLETASSCGSLIQKAEPRNKETKLQWKKLSHTAQAKELCSGQAIDDKRETLSCTTADKGKGQGSSYPGVSAESLLAPGK